MVQHKSELVGTCLKSIALLEVMICIPDYSPAEEHPNFGAVDMRVRDAESCQVFGEEHPYLGAVDMLCGAFAGPLGKDETLGTGR